MLAILVYQYPGVFLQIYALQNVQAAVLTYPVPLEAILTAEEGLLAQLLACWALQTTGIVVAVGALAFPVLVHGDLFRWCLVHGCAVRVRTVVRRVIGKLIAVDAQACTAAASTSAAKGSSNGEAWCCRNRRRKICLQHLSGCRA